MTLDVYFDGGTRGNKICVVRRDRIMIKHLRTRQTNNQLEYSALLFAVKTVFKDQKHPIRIRFVGDSKLVINQMNGSNEVRSKKLIDLHQQVVEECKLIKNSTVIFDWVSRDKNVAGLELDKK